LRVYTRAVSIGALCFRLGRLSTIVSPRCSMRTGFGPYFSLGPPGVRVRVRVIFRRLIVPSSCTAEINHGQQYNQSEYGAYNGSNCRGRETRLVLCLRVLCRGWQALGQGHCCESGEGDRVWTAQASERLSNCDSVDRSWYRRSCILRGIHCSIRSGGYSPSTLSSGASSRNRRGLIVLSPQVLPQGL